MDGGSSPGGGGGSSSSGSGGEGGTRVNPTDLDNNNNNNNNNNNSNDNNASLGRGGMQQQQPTSPRTTASGLRRTSANSSPAIFSGSSSMRRTMSGSKRSAPNEDFGGGMGMGMIGRGGGAGGGHHSSRNVNRIRPSTMSRSSTYTATTSTNAVWDLNSGGGHPGGGGGGGGSVGGNANWGGGSAHGLSAGFGRDRGEEANYQRSIGQSMNNIPMGGGVNPGSNPFLSSAGNSNADMSQILNRHNLLQQTAPSTSGGGGGSSSGGAGLVFDPRLGTVSLVVGGGDTGRRIPKPTGSDFLSMMGIIKPGNGGMGGSMGGGSKGGSVESLDQSAQTTCNTQQSATEVLLNDTQPPPTPESMQGFKIQKKGSAMLCRSSQNLTNLQRYKLSEEEEEGTDVDGDNDSDGRRNANFGASGAGLQLQQSQRQPTTATATKEVGGQEKTQSAASKSFGGANDSASNKRDGGGLGGGDSQTSIATGLSNLSGFSDISVSDMQMLFNEELGGTGPGGGPSVNGSISSSIGSGLGGFDFDQHAREVATEVTEQVAAKLLADSGGGESGSGGGTGSGTVDGGAAANKATGRGEPEVDYGALLAGLEPTPISAQAEQMLYARRQSTVSMGSEHSGTSALAGGISTLRGLGGVSSVAPSQSSSTPGMQQQQQQQQQKPQQQPSRSQQHIQEQQFSSMGARIESASSGGLPACPGIQQLPQHAMQSPPMAAVAAAGMAVVPDQTNSVNPAVAAVQSQLQHVAHGGAGIQQEVTASALGMKSIDGPRDSSWMVSAILQLSKVGPKVPDRDGLLPVHLACLYCPNEKKLVGNILIDNPESATFIVNPPPENLYAEGPNANPQDVIMSLTSNALAAARKKANPSVMMSQLQGSYPLHISLRSFGGEKVTYEVVKLLSLSGPGVLTTPDPFGCVPLSIALQNKVGSQIIRYLLEQNKDSARVPDRDGNYPLHHACVPAGGRKRYSLAIIKLLTQSYPKALAKKNKDGKKPLDLAYGPDGKDDYLKEGKSDTAIEFLEKTYEKIKRKHQEKIASESDAK